VKRIKIFGRIENLFDRHYEETLDSAPGRPTFWQVQGRSFEQTRARSCWRRCSRAAEPPARKAAASSRCAPSVTETLFAVGAGADVVGVSDLSDYPDEARRIDRVGSYMKPNVEIVVAHRPDLVIAVPSPGNREAVEALVNLGLRVVVVEEGPTLADVLAAIRRIGDEAGRSEAARALASRLAQQVEAVRRRVAPLPPRRTLMVVGENR
jgi:iron complex transport system substrate-binding protein